VHASATAGSELLANDEQTKDSLLVSARGTRLGNKARGFLASFRFRCQLLGKLAPKQSEQG
jgi:hypothetical protein